MDHADQVLGANPMSIGQEGIAMAIAQAREPDDRQFVGHRNHHHFVACGCSISLLYAEILGRDGGPQRGRSGSLHFVDPAHGFLHTSAMVGAAAPLATGAALANKRLERPGIVFACFGDGAIGEGVVSESFVLARMWDLAQCLHCA